MPLLMIASFRVLPGPRCLSISGPPAGSTFSVLPKAKAISDSVAVIYRKDQQKAGVAAIQDGG